MITIAHEARLWGSPNARMVDGTGGVDWGWEYRAESLYPASILGTLMC